MATIHISTYKIFAHTYTVRKHQLSSIYYLVFNILDFQNFSKAIHQIGLQKNQSQNNKLRIIYFFNDNVIMYRVFFVCLFFFNETNETTLSGLSLTNRNGREHIVFPFGLQNNEKIMISLQISDQISVFVWKGIIFSIFPGAALLDTLWPCRPIPPNGNLFICLYCIYVLLECDFFSFCLNNTEQHHNEAAFSLPSVRLTETLSRAALFWSPKFNLALINNTAKL